VVHHPGCVTYFGSGFQVLDFTIGMHSDTQLNGAHRRVLEAFRTHRTVSAAGVREWNRVNRSDRTTYYVLSEIEHHVHNSIDFETVASDTQVASWLQDQPADCIVEATARHIGCDTLMQMAKQAEASENWWGAACIYGAAASLTLITNGRDEAQDLWRQCIDTVAKVSGADRATNQEDVDQLELDQLCDLLMSLNEVDVVKYEHRIEYLRHSAAAKRNPDSAFCIMMFGDCLLPCLQGDTDGMATAFLRLVEWLSEEGCRAPRDKSVRELCTVVYAGCVGWVLPILCNLEQFGWDRLGGGHNVELVELASKTCHSSLDVPSWTL
jgi:hypothetical protein